MKARAGSGMNSSPSSGGAEPAAIFWRKTRQSWIASSPPLQDPNRPPDHNIANLFRRACAGETDAIIEWLRTARRPESRPIAPSLTERLERLEERVARLESEAFARTERLSLSTAPATLPAPALEKFR